MISNWLSGALARRNIHYGWVMVGVTFLTALISAGAVGAPGVFIVPLQKEFGWTTAQISSALSIRFVLFGLMAPFAAALLNRYGLRNVTLAALLTVVSALVISLAMTQVWQLMLLWGVVVVPDHDDPAVGDEGTGRVEPARPGLPGRDEFPTGDRFRQRPGPGVGHPGHAARAHVPGRGSAR